MRILYGRRSDIVFQRLRYRSLEVLRSECTARVSIPFMDGGSYSLGSMLMRCLVLETCGGFRFWAATATVESGCPFQLSVNRQQHPAFV